MKKLLTCLLTAATLSGTALPAAAADDSVRKSLTIPTQWATHEVTQAESYKLQASAGALNIKLAMLNFGPVLIQVEDASGQVLLARTMQGADTRAAVELPAAGTYHLTIAPNLTGAVTIDAMDLVASKTTPAITLPGLKPYETRNERFAITPLATDAASVKLLLGTDRTLSDGPPAPVTLDPATLADGIYRLTAVAEAAEGNLGITGVPFLVDRVSTFSDVAPAYWARPYVEVMGHLGIINGRSAGAFAPDQPVTRAEFAKMLALTLGLPSTSGATATEFADVPQGHWARGYVGALAGQGLIRGEAVEGQVFYYPDRTITRAEAATIVGRALGVTEAPDAGSQISFADAGEVPTWAWPAVATLADAGWVKGFPDGKYYPAATLKRDQAARVLANFLGMQ